MPALPPLSPSSTSKTYLIVGASRGIGLEFVRQLLDLNHVVIATARDATGGSQLWALTGSTNGRNLTILECDVSDEKSIKMFVGDVGKLGLRKIDVAVLNAGVLVYPNRMTEV